MIYLRSVRFDHVLDYADIDWKRGLPSSGTNTATVWTLVTVVRDASMSVEESKFYKSIHSECNDAGKKGSFFTMLTQLRHAVRQDDYQGALKGTSVQVKDAGKFDYRGQKHKIWELKYKNKDRIYFFTHQAGAKESIKYLILLLFHHKKDQTTPKQISDYCEKTMKPFLENNPEITLIKESP